MYKLRGPVNITEKQLRVHAPHSKATMMKFWPISESVLLEGSPETDRKESIELASSIPTLDGRTVDSRTKFRTMFGSTPHCVVGKIFGANEKASKILGINRMHAVEILFDLSTGLPIGILGGNHITEIRTALSAVIGLASLMSRIEVENTDIAIIGLGRIGEAVAYALSALPNPPSKVYAVDKKPKNLRRRLSRLNGSVDFEIVPIQELSKVRGRAGIMIDCLSANGVKEVVTMADLGGVTLYVDVSKQTLSISSASLFDFAVFDSLRLGTKLPSIAREMKMLKPTLDVFELSEIASTRRIRKKDYAGIYTVIGVPSVDAAITEVLFSEISGIKPEGYTDLALEIARGR